MAKGIGLPQTIIRKQSEITKMKTTLKTLICTALCCAASSAFAVPPQPNASTAIAFKDGCAGNVVPSVGLNGAGTADVYVVTTTTSTGIDPAITPAVIDLGNVQLQISANTSTGLPTTVTDTDQRWVRIDTNGPGATPSSGVACFPVDLDNLASLGISWIDPDTGLSVTLKNATCDNTTIGFQAHYVPAGAGNPHADNHFSAGTPLTIECDECGTSTNLTLSEGSLIGPSQVAAPLGNTCWTYTFTVENCTDSDLTNVKVQGGTSGWTSLSGASATKGTPTVKNNNKNSIITWIGNLAVGESVDITVQVCGSLKASACGTTQFLSGPWSAAYTDPDTLLPAKTDYTDRFSINVVCP